MKAIHKYKDAAKTGNKEAQRRIAQSFGYRTSIWDSPQLIALLQRADIINIEDKDTDSIQL
jgi:hypothetical protein